MIVAPIEDRALRAVVRRAALPVEDVFHGLEEVRYALQVGFPRLLICESSEQRDFRSFLPPGRNDIPILALAGPTLRSWEAAWEAQGLAVSPMDDSALRLRSIIRDTARRDTWVDTVFSDLTQTVGRRLPSDFRGFARRILEFPRRYSSLASVGEAVDLSVGALKARFRRRGLPSPSRHLRWFRLLAAARVLSDPDETVLSAAYRLGFASDGNFCRWVRATSGLSPSTLRGWNGRLLVLVRLAEDCLPEGSLDAWEDLGGLFLREVA